MIFHSINKQINVTSGASLGAAILVMILVGVVLSNSLFSTTSTSLRNYSQDIISESLRTIKSDIQEVEAIISDTVRLAKDTATTQEYLIRSGLMSSVTREKISEYAQNTLAANERILGLYYLGKERC